jgi:hypothetical protein
LTPAFARKKVILFTVRVAVDFAACKNQPPTFCLFYISYLLFLSLVFSGSTNTVSVSLPLLSLSHTHCKIYGATDFPIGSACLQLYNSFHSNCRLVKTRPKQSGKGELPLLFQCNASSTDVGSSSADQERSNQRNV